jgi:hypothetical protein
MRPIVLVLSATALVAASSQPIRADPIHVDQVSSLSAAPANAASSSAATATSPSMVVGISGQLVALDVFLRSWSDEGTADGRAANYATAPADVSSVLASRTITPFGMPPGLARAPVHFDLASAQLQVLAGRLLAMIEGNPVAAQGVELPGPAMTASSPNATVSGGSGGTGGGGLGEGVNVQADPTPEPTTIALVGSGLLLGAMGRRRQRKLSSTK